MRKEMKQDQQPRSRRVKAAIAVAVTVGLAMFLNAVVRPVLEKRLEPFQAKTPREQGSRLDAWLGRLFYVRERNQTSFGPITRTPTTTRIVYRPPQLPASSTID